MPKKPCKDNQIRNPDSGRCVNKDGKVGKEILKKIASAKAQKKSPKSPKKPSPKPNKQCPDDKVYNHISHRCVKKDGKIGKEILKKIAEAKAQKKSPKKVSPKKVSPKKVSPKKVSPKKVSPKKVSPKKVTLECRNKIEGLSQEDTKDIPKEKLIKVWHGYCYNIDYLVEYLISNKGLNMDPIVPNKYKLWRTQNEQSRIINHKGLDKDIKNRYIETRKQYIKEQEKFIEILTLDKDNVRLLNAIPLLAHIFGLSTLNDIKIAKEKFLELLNKNKYKDTWNNLDIYGWTLGELISQSADTCNHAMSTVFYKHYIGLYYILTHKYKINIKLSEHVYKLSDNIYLHLIPAFQMKKTKATVHIVYVDDTQIQYMDTGDFSINANGKYEIYISEYTKDFAKKVYKEITEILGESPSYKVKTMFTYFYNISSIYKSLEF